MKRLTKKQVTEIERLQNDAQAAINALKDELEDVRSEMDGYYEARSEKWQESGEGEAYLTWIEIFGEAIDQLEAVEATFDTLPEQPE